MPIRTGRPAPRERGRGIERPLRASLFRSERKSRLPGGIAARCRKVRPEDSSQGIGIGCIFIISKHSILRSQTIHLPDIRGSPKSTAMTAPGTPVETLPLAQPFGTGHREPQALRETQPAGATCAAEEAPMAPLHRPGRAGGWTGFLTRILRPTPEISGPRA